MNCTLTLCTAAALTVLTLNAGSLMPEKGKISIHGADGASFRQKNNVLILKREKPGVQLFLRGMIRFRPELKGTFAPDDALVLVLKTEKDATLRMRWRKNDKRICHLPDFPIQGKPEFQKLILPLPSSILPGSRTGRNQGDRHCKTENHHTAHRRQSPQGSERTAFCRNHGGRRCQSHNHNPPVRREECIETTGRQKWEI